MGSPVFALVAMGRPRGSKNFKSVAKGKGTANVPSSSNAKKTKSVDEVMGVGTLQIQDPNSSEEEGEIPSPLSSLMELQRQSADKSKFSQWLNVLNIGSKTPKQVSWANETGETNKHGDVDINVDETGLINHQKINNDEHIPTIDLDDIKDEIKFWESSVMCYVLGANPPLSVFEGFIRRIWGEMGIDKIASIGREMFIVRCLNLENRDKIVHSGFRLGGE